MTLRKLLLTVLLFCPALVLAQGYVVWSGGVGEQERTEAPQEGIRLVFFVEDGAYLSDVQVTVSDSNGEELVNTTAEGPWLILNLPQGQYSVQARRDDGQIQSAVINVTADSRQQYGFMFQD